jgi:hypothetical protein
MESLSLTLGIAGMLVPIMIIGSIVGVIVYSVNNKDKKVNFSIRMLLNVYFYFMIFIMVLIGVGGLATLTNSGLSYAFGVPFSYQIQAVNNPEIFDGTSKPMVDGLFQKCYTGEVTKFDNIEYCFDKESQKRDMVTGLTLFLSMAVLLVIHVVGLIYNSKAEPAEFLKKVYLFLSLGLYGIMSIVLLPTSIYMLVEYGLYSQSDLSDYNRVVPGQPLSWVIYALPLWIYFLVTVLKLREPHAKVEK